MKELLSKEHYYYKTHTLLMKHSAYFLLQSTQKNPSPPDPFFDFLKISTHL